MSTWSLTYKQSVFKRYRSDKHFSRSFQLQDGGKINWLRYGTKWRDYHRMCRPLTRGADGDGVAEERFADAVAR